MEPSGSAFQLAMGAEGGDADQGVVAPVGAFIRLPPRLAGGPGAHGGAHAGTEQLPREGGGGRPPDDQLLQDAGKLLDRPPWQRQGAAPPWPSSPNSASRQRKNSASPAWFSRNSITLPALKPVLSARRRQRTAIGRPAREAAKAASAASSAAAWAGILRVGEEPQHRSGRRSRRASSPSSSRARGGMTAAMSSLADAHRNGGEALLRRRRRGGIQLRRDIGGRALRQQQDGQGR